MTSYKDKLIIYKDYVLNDTASFGFPNYYKGKVRDNYDLPENRRLLISSDRFSSFDQILTTIPLRGQVLTQLSKFWFEKTQDICPNHVLSYPDPNAVLCQSVNILPIEMVVRDYITGSTITSIWPMYQKGQRHMYGHDFPDGLHQNEKLPDTILTPTTKGHGKGGDIPTSAQEIVNSGLMPAALWDEVAAVSLELFKRGRDIAAQNGLILVDTKYEFGLDTEGKLVLADEIHTPDSSRYWFADDYAQSFKNGTSPKFFDKEFIRRWVVAQCDPYKDTIPTIPDEIRLQTSEIYIQAYEQITGQTFNWPDPSLPPEKRVYEAVKGLFE